MTFALDGTALPRPERTGTAEGYPHSVKHGGLTHSVKHGGKTGVV